MPGKIFYRERRKVKDGEKMPRYRVVAVADCNLKIYTDHLRLSELLHLSEEVQRIHRSIGNRGPRAVIPGCGRDEDRGSVHLRPWYKCPARNTERDCC